MAREDNERQKREESAYKAAKRGAEAEASDSDYAPAAGGEAMEEDEPAAAGGDSSDEE